MLQEGFVGNWTAAENGIFDAITNAGGEASGTFPDPIREGSLCSWAVDGRSVTLLFQDGIRFTYPRADFRRAVDDARGIGNVTAAMLLEVSKSLGDLCDVLCSPIGSGAKPLIPSWWKRGTPPDAQMGVVPGSYIAVAWDDRQILADVGDALAIIYRAEVAK